MSERQLRDLAVNITIVVGGAMCVGWVTFFIVLPVWLIAKMVEQL